MNQIIFLHALNEILNNKRFVDAYVHTVLPLKKCNIEQYHRGILKIVLMYADDFIDSLNFDKNELDYINISDNLDWDAIEKLIMKKDDLPSED